MQRLTCSLQLSTWALLLRMETFPPTSSPPLYLLSKKWWEKKIKERKKEKKELPPKRAEAKKNNCFKEKMHKYFFRICFKYETKSNLLELRFNTGCTSWCFIFVCFFRSSLSISNGNNWRRVWINTHAHKNADSKKKSFHSLALLKNTVSFQQQTFPPQSL